MLDFAVVGRDVYKRALNTVTAIKGPRAVALSHEKVDTELFAAITDLDPTPKLKYMKWILTRLYRNPASIIEGLIGNDGMSGTLRGLLVEFEGVKHLLPAHMRDIFNYHSLERLEEVVGLMRKDRYKASKFIRNTARSEEVMAATLLMGHDGLTVHRARSVEDVILLTGSDEVFDLRGEKLYRNMASYGEVFIFITGYGVFVGALPRTAGHKGILFDCMGEPGMFEDALMAHRDVNWESAPEIITLMAKIDPALPFDEEMEEIEPYIAALNQFPLVLHEDREIPDDMIDRLLESGLLSQEAMDAIRELA